MSRIFIWLLVGCNSGESVTEPDIIQTQGKSSEDNGDKGHPDFGNSFWGDNMEQVYTQESGGLWRLYTAVSEFGGLSAAPYFQFDKNGKLCSGSYTNLKNPDMDNFTAYKTARKYLVGCYGEPMEENFYDINGIVLSSLEEAANTGGWAEAKWYIKTTENDNGTRVNLRLVRDGSVKVDFIAEETGMIQENKPDFGNSFWGCSREDVYKNEGGGQWQLQTIYEFAGALVPTYFGFQEKELLLNFGYYDLTESDMDGLTKNEKYETAREYLTALNGEPAIESFIGQNTKLPSLDGAEEAYAIWYIKTPQGDRKSVVGLSYKNSGILVSVNSM